MMIEKIIALRVMSVSHIYPLSQIQIQDEKQIQIQEKIQIQICDTTQIYIYTYKYIYENGVTITHLSSSIS